MGNPLIIEIKLDTLSRASLHLHFRSDEAEHLERLTWKAFRKVHV
jgi:hypothetical protein